MRFSSIQQIQLVLRVKKQSQTGLFKNQRLLAIKSGYISYYSRIPKQFVGNTRSLQLIGQFPKYTLSAQFVTAIHYEYHTLQLTFLKDKLIDKDNFQRMVSSTNDSTSQIVTENNKNPNIHSWKFKCKQKDLANAFVEQVKSCMKPQASQQQKDDSKSNRVSLQPNLKVHSKFQINTRQQRKSKQVQDIINERSSNYFSSSQIQNDLKKRNTDLRFSFLRNKSPENKKIDKSKSVLDKSLFPKYESAIIKPIEVPVPYQPQVQEVRNIQQNSVTEVEQPKISQQKKYQDLTQQTKEVKLTPENQRSDQLHDICSNQDRTSELLTKNQEEMQTQPQDILTNEIIESGDDLTQNKAIVSINQQQKADLMICNNDQIIRMKNKQTEKIQLESYIKQKEIKNESSYQLQGFQENSNQSKTFHLQLGEDTKTQFNKAVLGQKINQFNQDRKLNKLGKDSVNTQQQLHQDIDYQNYQTQLTKLNESLSQKIIEGRKTQEPLSKELQSNHFKHTIHQEKNQNTKLKAKQIFLIKNDSKIQNDFSKKCPTISNVTSNAIPDSPKITEFKEILQSILLKQNLKQKLSQKIIYNIKNISNFSKDIQINDKFESVKQVGIQIQGKNIKFTMWTDFINYNSLLQHSPQYISQRQVEKLIHKSLDSSKIQFPLQKILPQYLSKSQIDYLAQNDFITKNYRQKDIFQGYTSKLYRKFLFYQFLSMNFFQNLQDMSEIQKFILPEVFYFQYQSFEVLAIQIKYYSQWFSNNQHEFKQIRQIPEVWKQFNKIISISPTLLMNRQHIDKKKDISTEINILTHFSEEFDIMASKLNKKYLIQIEQKKFIEKNKSSKKLQTQQQPQKSSFRIQNYQDFKPIKILSQGYLYENVTIFKSIKQICLSQICRNLKQQQLFLFSKNLSLKKQIQLSSLIVKIQKCIFQRQQIRFLLANSHKIDQENQFLMDYQNRSKTQNSNEPLTCKFVENIVKHTLEQLLGYTEVQQKLITFQIHIQQIIHHKQKQYVQFVVYAKSEQFLLMLRKTTSMIEHVSPHLIFQRLKAISSFLEFIQKTNSMNSMIQLSQKNSFSKGQIMNELNKVFQQFQKTIQIVKHSNYRLRQLYYNQQNTLKANKQKSIIVRQSNEQNLPSDFFMELFQTSLSIVKLEVFGLHFKQKTKNETQQNQDNLQKQHLNNIQLYVLKIYSCIKLLSSTMRNSDNSEDKVQNLKMIKFAAYLSKEIVQLYQTKYSIITEKNALSLQKLSIQVLKTLDKEFQEAIVQIQFIQKFINIIITTLSQTSNHSRKQKLLVKNQTSKYKLKIIEFQMQNQISLRLCCRLPKNYSFETLLELLIQSIDNGDHFYFGQCFDLMINLWRHKYFQENRLIEIFVHVIQMQNIFTQNTNIKRKIVHILQKQITIQQRIFYLKKYPQLQQITFNKTEPSSQTN